MSVPEFSGGVLRFVTASALGGVYGLALATVVLMLRPFARRTVSRIEALAALVGVLVLTGVLTRFIDWDRLELAVAIAAGLLGSAIVWWGDRRIVAAAPLGASAVLPDHDFRRSKRGTDRRSQTPRRRDTGFKHLLRLACSPERTECLELCTQEMHLIRGHSEKMHV